MALTIYLYLNLIDIVFTINGIDFPLTQEQYLRNIGHDTCQLGLQGMDMGSPAWILGDVFLMAYYSVYDGGNNQVGFATSVAQPPK